MVGGEKFVVVLRGLEKMPLGQRAGDKSESRYCGIETEFNDDMPQVLHQNISGGFDFVVAPLVSLCSSSSVKFLFNLIEPLVTYLYGIFALFRFELFRIVLVIGTCHFPSSGWM